jgi:hypothetical protein
MSKYQLDYANTCPDIDSEISDAKGVIESHFYGTLRELNPLMEDLMETEPTKLWIKNATDHLYSDLESIFENCRSINENMRAEANRQIAECMTELEEANHTIDNLMSE